MDTGSWIGIVVVMLGVFTAIMAKSRCKDSKKCESKKQQPALLAILSGLFVAGIAFYKVNEDAMGNPNETSLLALIVIPAIIILVGLFALFLYWRKSQE